MKQLAINYYVKEHCSAERIFSRVFLLKAEDVRQELQRKEYFFTSTKYIFVEIYAFRFNPIKKNLSKHIVKYFLRTQGQTFSNIYCFIFPFNALEDLEMELGRFMLREDIKRVCNWVKNETICN